MHLQRQHPHPLGPIPHDRASFAIRKKIPGELSVGLPPLPESVLAAVAPKWDLENTTHRCCPVCTANAPAPICERPDGLNVVQCDNCEMLYVTDAPHPSVLENFYECYGRHKGYQCHKRRLSWAERALHSMRDPNIRILETSGGIKNQSLLEVGSSYGRFLQLARHRGALVSAVEWDGEARTHLVELGIPASAEINTREAYDIVCAFEVIEHLADPASVVAEIARVLRDDGRFLLSLPNGGEYKNVGPTWAGFRVDLEHLNYFSVHTLARLFAAHGLFIEQYWEYGQPDLRRGSADIPQRWSKWAKVRMAGATLLRELFNDRGQAGGPGLLHVAPGSFVLTVLARRGPITPSHSPRSPRRRARGAKA